MDSRPTLYLSNFASYRTPGMHGPGAKWSIMLWTPERAKRRGAIEALQPGDNLARLTHQLVGLRRLGHRDENLLATYRTGYEDRLARLLHHEDVFEQYRLSPGLLRCVYSITGENDVAEMQSDDGVRVRDGDTLCCACSVAEARAGRCHRTWAAPFLVRAGWRVVLDGVEVSDV